ncbi:MAG TPA: TetR/AcrR family transcriptional regulator, partial [Conexibacter sp.]|nr:TetR/AcrR family transcriptional regulator [Conexibacter sp.]
QGYSATGIAEIEQAVGLGRGALYHHIGSKENLLYEISRSHVLDMVEYGEQLALEDLTAEEKFRALARRLMTTIAGNLAELTVFFSDHRALSKAHAAELTEIRNRFERLWVAILAQGVEEGTLRETSPVVVKGVLGMFNYSYLWLRPRGEESPEQIADEFCDVLLAGLKTS